MLKCYVPGPGGLAPGGGTGWGPGGTPTGGNGAEMLRTWSGGSGPWGRDWLGSGGYTHRGERC